MSRRKQPKQKVTSHGIEVHSDQVNKLNQEAINSKASTTGTPTIERTLWGMHAKG
jgi:hypothetical protein